MPHCKTVKHYEDLFAVRRDYELRADGKRIGVTETLQVTDGNGSSGEQTNVIDWEYDALGRLVDEVFDTELQTYDNPWEQTEDGSTRPLRDYADHYEFDLAGNRVRKTNPIKGVRTHCFHINESLDPGFVRGDEVTVRCYLRRTLQVTSTSAAGR